MEMNEILDFVESEADRFAKHFGKSDLEMKYRSALKLAEEAGECVGEALKHLGMQRKEKLDAMDEEELGKEMADVIFVTMIMAKRFNVDIRKAMKEKMEIVKGRNY
jgi:NTP pyrophosphatase (non-canonical NTP hydrolase)